MRAAMLLALLLAGCIAEPRPASADCASGDAPRALIVTSGGGLVPPGWLPLVRAVDRDGTYREVQAHTEEGSGTQARDMDGTTAAEARKLIEDARLDLTGKKLVIHSARALPHERGEFEAYCASLAGIRGLGEEYREDVDCVDGGRQIWSVSTGAWSKRVEVFDCARGSEEIAPFARALQAYGTAPA